MSYPLPLTRTEAYLAYKAGVIQQSELKPSLAVPRIGIDAWLAYWTQLANDYPKNPDGTPMVLQEEEAYIAYLCGVIDTYPEKCLRRVGAYLRYIISARWGRPDHPLNREELYLSLIKTQFIPSGDPSSDIEIDGTAKAAFVDVKMYGDTYQQTYSGKNLAAPYNAPTNPLTVNGMTCTWNAEEQTMTFNGTASDNNTTFLFIKNDIGIIAGTTNVCAYYVSGSKTGYCKMRCFDSSYDGYVLDLANLSSSNTMVKVENNNKTITLDHTKSNIRFDTGATATNFKIKLMIANSNDTDYEPFVGGTPSPNPDYPQAIQTVTGLQMVEITGKNLFDKSDQSILRNRRVSTSNGGTYNENGWSVSPPIKVKSGETYTVGGVGQTSYYCWFKDGVYISGSGVVPNGRVTAPSGANQIRFDYPTANEAQIQFELGSTATTYAPYSKQTYPLDLGSIELCKLGAYQDYIYKDGDDWKVRKEINSITYDGTNYGFSSRQGTGVSGKYRFLLEGSAAESSIWESSSAAYFTGVCDMLISGTRNSTYAASGNIVAPRSETSYGNVGVIYTDAIAGMTFEQANTWLITHNMTVKYALATPTDTTITDTNLIDQLNALKQGGSEDGTTYIKVSATEPNLPAKLYVEAPKYD